MAEKFNRATFTRNFLKKITRIKNPDEMLADAKSGGLEKTLGVMDLIILGVGAIIGSGIFAVVGIAAAGSADGSALGAGPGLVVSMIIAAIACIFSALCYSEFATMIPVAGGAYTYTFATLGEFAAWIVGWVLMLNYVIGNITVASSWCGYLTQFLKGFSQYLPNFIVNCPIWLRSDVRTIYHMCEKNSIDVHDKIPFLFNTIPFAINLPVIALTLISTLILIKGIKESTRFATIMVGLNLFMITSFIIVGSFYVKPENWTPFAPNGFSGILMGAFIIFFAYIGFDAVSTAAEETKNPQKDLPIAILGTLIFCTILYVLVALVLTGIVPINQINPTAPIAAALHLIDKDFLAGFISIAAVCALASVFLICQLASTRILYAMSRDKFLPKILRSIHRKHRTPHIMTWVVGIVIIICSLFMDLNISAELCNYGTFTSFIAICIAVLILRKLEPNLARPFKVPFVPLFPILGIISCLTLIIFSLQQLTTSAIMFPLWILIGIIIYFSFRNKVWR